MPGFRWRGASVLAALFSICSAARAAEAAFDIRLVRLAFAPHSTAIDGDAVANIEAAGAVLAECAACAATLDAGASGNEAMFYTFLRKTRLLRVFEALSRGGIGPERLQLVDPKSGDGSQSFAAGDGEVVVTISAATGTTGTTASALPVATAEAAIEPMTIYFASAADEPLDFDQEALRQFLAKNPKGNLSILGQTDASGPAEFNTVLAQLRALTLFQRVVSLGFPAAQVSLSWRLTEPDVADGSVRPSDPKARLVLLTFEPLPASPLAIDGPSPVPAPVAEQLATQPSERPAPMPQQTTASDLLGLDIVVLAGASKAVGGVGNDVEPAFTWGLGVKYTVARDPGGAWRTGAALMRSRFAAKDSSLEGGIDLSRFDLHLDRRWEIDGAIDPFASVIAGIAAWSGRITQKATQKTNEDASTDPVLGLTLGAVYDIFGPISTSPQVRLQRVLGKLDSTLVDALVTLSWGF